jgi:Pin2-interacting protein X1
MGGKDVAEAGMGKVSAESASPWGTRHRRPSPSACLSRGKGLGKNEDGIKSHVRVAKKEETQGIGFRADAVNAQTWANSLLSGVPAGRIGGSAAVTLDSSSSDDSSSSSDDGSPGKAGTKRRRTPAAAAPTASNSRAGSSTAATVGIPAAPFGDAPSFEELFAATGGARLGMRARAAQPGKIARAEHGGSSSNKSAGRGGGDEGAPAPAPEVDKAAQRAAKRAAKDAKRAAAAGELAAAEEEAGLTRDVEAKAAKKAAKEARRAAKAAAKEEGVCAPVPEPTGGSARGESLAAAAARHRPRTRSFDSAPQLPESAAEPEAVPVVGTGGGSKREKKEKKHKK